MDEDFYGENVTKPVPLSPIDVSRLPWSVLGNRALSQHASISQRLQYYSPQSESNKKEPVALSMDVMGSVNQELSQHGRVHVK